MASERPPAASRLSPFARGRITATLPLEQGESRRAKREPDRASVKRRRQGGIPDGFFCKAEPRHDPHAWDSPGVSGENCPARGPRNRIASRSRYRYTTGVVYSVSI